MKKLLLGLGLVSVAILPVAGLVACASEGDSNPDDKPNPSKKEIKLTLKADLDATKVNDVAIAWNALSASASDNEKIAVLAPLFNETITATFLSAFSVEAIEATGTNVATITLKITNTEYEFSGNKDTLSVQVDETGNQIVTIDLQQKYPSAIWTFDAVMAMIEEYKLVTSDVDKMGALTKMFDPATGYELTLEKFKQFEVSVERVEEDNGRVTLIKLLANDGFIFKNVSDETSSTIQYTFRPIGLTFKAAGEVLDSDVEAIVNSWAGATNVGKMALLNPFFEENTEEIGGLNVLNNTSIIITDTTLTIKALGVYMFDNGVGSMTFPWTS
ncbi:MAG: hypothetical protein ACRDCH_03060 [Metamycoplasmataceae bacterium]